MRKQYKGVHIMDFDDLYVKLSSLSLKRIHQEETG